MIDQSTHKTVSHISASKTTNIVSSISNFFTQPAKSKKYNDDKDNNSNNSNNTGSGSGSGSGSGYTDSNMKWNATNNRENFNLIKDEEIEQLVRSR